jgi:hypothetical protein
MRLSPCLATLASISLAASTGLAEPAAQSCIGDWNAFLTCPAGATRLRNECRDHDDGSWGGPRHGPSLMLHFVPASEPGPPGVMIAANYQDDQRTGRAFRFERDGRLAGWDDLLGDQRHGASVSCRDGRVTSLAYFSHNHRAGLARSWSAHGELLYATVYDGHGHGARAEPTPAVLRRPDELCQPKRCDVTAKPDLSGLPAGLR